MSAKERKERRQRQEIPPEQEGPLTAEEVQQLQDVAGFLPEEIHERRGALVRVGIQSLLGAGDRLVEVHADHAVVRRKDGSLQSVWNLRRDPPWVQRVGKDSGANQGS